MNIVDFKGSLKYLFKAQITPFVWGHAGIGKSSIIKQYAESQGYHFFPLYLGTQSDLGDVLGLADFVRDVNGTAIATTFATPIWLKNCIDYCNHNPDSGAIIFLDEFNRARRDVLQGMFSLALDKTFHTTKLPKNCYIVAAGNPPTDEYQVTDINETALMARFAHIKLEPTVDEWVAFAEAKHYSQDLIGFIKEQPELLEDVKSHYALPVKVDRRSYDRMQQLFNVNTPEHLLFQLMTGILGAERTVAFQKRLGSADKPLEAEVVLSGGGGEKLSQWITSSDVKSSLVAGTSDNLVAFLISTPKLTTSQMDHLMTFLCTVPKEIAYIFVQKCLQSNSKSFAEMLKVKKHENQLADIIRSAKGKKKEHSNE